MQISSLNLNDAMGDVTKMLARLIGEDIKLQCRLAPSLRRVEAGVSMMEQMLMNLAVNARDAISKGGQLTIALSKWRLPRLIDEATRRRERVISSA